MKRILFLSVAVAVLVTAFPQTAMSQRIGNGRLLRRMFGMESEEDLAPEIRIDAKKPTPKPPPKVNVTSPYPGRTPARQYPPTAATRKYPAPSASRQYRVSPNSKSPTTVKSRPQLEPVPLPRAPVYPNTRRRPPVPKASDYAKRREPTPARKSPTFESPLSSSPAKSPKMIEHDQFGIHVKSVGKNVVVTRVIKNGTAAGAGLKNGDIVKSIGEIPIEKPADIQQLDDVLEAGDTVEFELIRKGKPLKELVAFEKDPRNEEPMKLSLVDSDDEEPVPTLAVRPASPVDGPEMEQLRDIVESQQQLIDQLRRRLDSLESTKVPEIRPTPKLEPVVDALPPLILSKP